MEQDVGDWSMFKRYIYNWFLIAFHWTSSSIGWTSLNFPLLWTWHLLLPSHHLQCPANGSWFHVVDRERCCNIAHVHFCQTKSSMIAKHEIWKEVQNAQPLLTSIDSLQNMCCNDCEWKKRANSKWTYLRHQMKMNGEDAMF